MTAQDENLDFDYGDFETEEETTEQESHNQDQTDDRYTKLEQQFNQLNEKLQRTEQENQQLAKWKQDMARMMGGESDDPQVMNQQLLQKLASNPNDFVTDIQSKAAEEAYKRLQQEQQQREFQTQVQQYVSNSYKDLVESGWENAIYAEAQHAQMFAQAQGNEITLQDALDTAAGRIRERLGMSQKQAQNKQLQRNAMHLDVGGTRNNADQGTPKLGGLPLEKVNQLQGQDWERFREKMLRQAQGY